MEYTTEIIEEAGGPDEQLRVRLATVAAYRLTRIIEKDAFVVEPGAQFDMLDNFEGPFLWEMSDEDLERNPPTSVAFGVVSSAETNGVVHVRLRVPF